MSKGILSVGIGGAKVPALAALQDRSAFANFGALKIWGFFEREK